MISSKFRILGVSLALAGTLLAACATVGNAPAPTAAQPAPGAIPDFVRKAVESKDRPEAAVARDSLRKPAEILALSGVKPGDRIVEFASFGQYFSQLLSDIAGPKGMVYMYDLPYTEARSGAASRAFVAARPNTRYELVNYNNIELPQNIDVVFNVLYYHDLPLNDIDTAKLNKRILAALKPGGIFFIIDHNAAPGSGMRDTKTLHRIDPNVIKQEVIAAGFELVAESKLLANPQDDYTKGISFAPGVRGTTDQSVLKFRKPAK